MTKRELWDRTFQLAVLTRLPEAAAMLADMAVKACGEDPEALIPGWMSDEEVWLRACCSALSCAGVSDDTACICANTVLDEFRRKFRRPKEEA